MLSPFNIDKMLSRIHFVYQKNVVTKPNKSLTFNVPNVSIEDTVQKHCI